MVLRCTKAGRPWHWRENAAGKRLGGILPPAGVQLQNSGAMRCRVLIMFLLGCSCAAVAQKNLVLNADFERYKSCPTNNDQIYETYYWTAIDSTYAGIYSCIPDYCNRCADASNNQTGVPASRQYWQWPHSGNGMVQAPFYRKDNPIGSQRDYLQGRLIYKLTAAKSYCVSFYVCLSEASKRAVKDISAYLDNGIIDTASECWRPQTRYIPQITNQGGIISDTMNWTKIEGSFIANGTEQFITLGNFKDNAATTKQFLPPNSYSSYFPLDSSAGYLIDDVSVVETGTKADAGPDKHVGYGDSVYIGLPSSEVIWNSWSVLGSSTIIGEGPGIWVKPTKTSSYVVTQTLCGTTTKDTVRVEVWAAGVQSINGQSQQCSIAPNPNNGAFELVQSVARDEQASVSIINAIGQRLYNGELSFKRGRASVDAVGLLGGVYYISLKTREGYVWNMRFVRE